MIDINIILNERFMIKIACKHAFEYQNLIFILDNDDSQLYIGSINFTDIFPSIWLRSTLSQMYYTRILKVEEVFAGSYNVTFEVVNQSAAFYPSLCYQIHIPKTLQDIIPQEKSRYIFTHKLGYFYKMYRNSMESLTYIKSAEADLSISQRLINEKTPYCLWILYIHLEQIDIVRYIFQIIGELISADFDSYKEIHYRPNSSDEECFNSDYF